MSLGNHLFRSCLYMPADNEKLLAKSGALPADCIIFDFEDAVAAERKAIARQMLTEHLTKFDQTYKPALARINAATTPWFEEDIEAISKASCFGLILPKVYAPEDILQLNEKLDTLGVDQDFEIWAMVETAASITNAMAIAYTAQNTRLTTFVFGTNDLAKETGAPLIKGRENMMHWLAQATIAAKAHGVRVIDSVMQDFGDTQGLKQECLQAMGLGMDGKSLIHPKQLETTNHLFSPNTDEIVWSQKIVETFEQEENRGKAVIKIDNKMVERLHFEMAQSLLTKHELILSKGF